VADLKTSDVASEALDRMGLVLTGKFIYPAISRTLNHYLYHQDWRYRVAGIFTISQTVESCREQLMSNINSIVTTLVNSFKDPHPRVRYAAANCIAQMASDIEDYYLQRQFHSKLIPAFMVAMDDPVMHTRGHALRALVNYLDISEERDAKVSAEDEEENAEGEAESKSSKKSNNEEYMEEEDEPASGVFVPYCEALMTKLLVQLQSPVAFIQRFALGAIAGVCCCARGISAKYFDRLIPHLTAILVSTKDGKNRAIQMNLIECISCIGARVNPKIFGPYLSQFMDYTFAIIETHGEAAGVMEEGLFSLY